LRITLPISAFGLLLAAATAWAQTPIASSTTTLNVSSGGNAVTSVVAGTAIELTAKVLAKSSPLTPGQVNFCNVAANYCTDIYLLGTAQLTAAGTATIRFTPGIGTHSYDAVFLGTNTTARSVSSVVTVTVTPAPLYPSNIDIAASGSPGNYTLTSEVIGGQPVAPTGTVSFLDTTNGNYVLGTAGLGNPVQTSALTFFNSSNPEISSLPIFLAVGDFNSDGKADIAAPNAVGAPLDGAPLAMTVAFGNGDGTFQPDPYNFTQSVPQANWAAIGDYNNDGNPDLALALNSQYEAVAMLGNGQGAFTAGQTYPTAGSWFVATADFNGDGNADLILGLGDSVTSDRLTVLLGKGDGTFTEAPPVLWPPIIGGKGTREDVVSIAVGDFNRDGKADFAALDFATGDVTVFLGNGDGTFTPVLPSQPAGTYPISIMAADFNGDGILDLAVANPGYVISEGAAPGSVTVLLGNGDGTFTPTAVNPVTGEYPYSVAAGDFNGDGIADIVTVNYEDNTETVLLGKGDGTFAAPITAFAGEEPTYAAVGDFNGDGYSDFAIANGDTPRGLSIVLAEQPGTISTTATATGISIVGTGTHWVEASYPGDSYYGGSVSQAIALTAEPVATTLSFTANPTSTALGMPVLLTATVSPGEAQNHVPTGTVTFWLGNEPFATANVTNGVATLNTTQLPLGADVLYAVYSGDTNFAPSTSLSITVTVAPPTTTTLTALPTSLTVGQTLTLTATVTAAIGGTPAGTVVFLNGTTSMGSATLNASGIATLTLTPAVGVYSITASYSGSSSDSPSASSPPIVVTVSTTTTTTLTAVPASLLVGQTLNLTATVTPASGAEPTGTVTFLNGTIAMGTATLNASGTATLALTPAVGVYSITASYGGSATDASSVSAPPVTVTVASPTTTTLIAAPTALTMGQTLTLTATVSAASGAVPSGTVTFVSGAITLGAAALNTSGVATLTLTPAVGVYSVVASYGGSSTEKPSVSAPPIAVTVTPALSATTLSASPNPAPLSAQVTFTASVSSSIGTPGGAVSFYDGATLLGTSSLQSGAAAFTINTLSVGSHNITAHYAGATDFAPSVSNLVAEVITLGNFTIAASPASRTIYTGEAAAYTITVAATDGFTLPVDLSCLHLPANTTCSFSTSTVADGSGTSTLTVQTSAPSKSGIAAVLRRKIDVPALAGILLLLLGKRARRVRKGWLALLALFVLLAGAALNGCGGAVSLTGGTPVGAQTITISGVATYGSQTLTNQTTVTLNVQSLF